MNSSKPLLRGAVLAAATVLLLSACSGGDDEADASASASASASTGETPGEAGEEQTDDAAAATGEPSATEEPYLPVPDDVSLTPQGSMLGLGDTATVAYQPRQDQVGVLDLTVTDLRETTFEESFDGWKLDAKTRKSTPYFVEATVRNVGRTDLGGQTVPLYLLDDAQTLVEPTTFDGDFEPCPSTPLPKQFTAKAKEKVCLTFLAPQGRSLAGVTFRPDQEFDAITWTGNVATPEKTDKPSGRSSAKPDQKSSEQ